MTLPYGSYRFTCEALGDTHRIERIVDVVAPGTYILLALPLADAGDSDGPRYSVEGTITQGSQKTSLAFVRLRGVFLSSAAEAKVDNAGRFKVDVAYSGEYELEAIGISNGEDLAKPVAHKIVSFRYTDHLHVDLALP